MTELSGLGTTHPLYAPNVHGSIGVALPGMEIVHNSRSGGTSLDDLLQRSDYVSLHAPLTPETRGLIGERELGLMKPTAILVNTARGPVVDTVALARALRDGLLAGAGIDVFEEAPLPPGHPLRDCPTAVLTPHSAAYTEESLAEVRKRPLADVLRILRGESPESPVPA